MSRSGYQDTCDQDWSDWDAIRWRGAVASAVRGRRGQRLLVDLVRALDAMPDRRLVRGTLVGDRGCVCALGAVWRARGLPEDVLPDDDEAGTCEVAQTLDVADALAREIVWINDECLPAQDLHGITMPPLWIGPDGRHIHAYGSDDEDRGPGWTYVGWRCRIVLPAEIERIERARWQHVRDWAWSMLSDASRRAVAEGS